MSKDRWGYTAIDSDGNPLATADSYDEPKKYDDATLCKIAKTLKKSLMDVKRML